MAILIMDDRLLDPVFFAAVARRTKFGIRNFLVDELVVDFARISTGRSSAFSAENQVRRVGIASR